MAEARVENLYRRLKEMTINFQFKPGERINEVSLSRELDASRTPLREALNRLVAEDLIEFQPGRGFFCRTLEAQSIFELYEMRSILEEASVRKACERASDKEIQDLADRLNKDGLKWAGKTILEITEQDEDFHLGIAQLAGNSELSRQLSRVNERIRFIRWIDMSTRLENTRDEHKEIMAAIKNRNVDKATELMHLHISKRMDQIVSAVKEGHGNIHMEGSQVVFERRIEEKT